jgi:hypothetical protein
MKKLIFVSLMVLLAVSVSFSQFGIKGGVNLGTVSGDDKSRYGVDPTSKLGITAGVSYRLGLIAGFAIQPEVLYMQKGTIYDNPFHKATMTFNYIEIPVLVKFSPLPLPVVSPYIEGGVSYGILVSAKEKMEYTGGTLPTTDTDIKSGMSKGDISILIGIGVELAMLDINARYVIGLTKITKDFSGNEVKVYNRGIMITAGFRF